MTDQARHKPITLVQALVKAQSEMATPIKDKVNPQFKSKYASLGSIIDAVKGALSELACDALHLEGLVPRRPCVDEQVAQRARDQHHVAIVMDAGQPHDVHGSPIVRPVLNIPKPGGCG